MKTQQISDLMAIPSQFNPLNSGTAAAQSNDETDNLRAVAWILISVVTASLMSLAVKELADDFDSRMIVMLRSGITAVLMAVPIYLLTPLRRHLRFSKPGQHIIRGTLIGFSTHLGFYTLTVIPLATASVLFFTAPIFATVLSVVVHGEQVGPRRWVAVLAGFVGAVIVLRPGFDGFHIAMLAALLSSLLFAVALSMSRNLARADGPLSAYFSSVVITALVSVPASINSFALPDTLWVWVVVAILVVTSASRGFADIQAYRYGEAAVLAPISYLRLVILGAAAYLIWDEVPDTFTVIGASVIILASLYIARREAVLARRRAKLPL